MATTGDPLSSCIGLCSWRSVPDTHAVSEQEEEQDHLRDEDRLFDGEDAHRQQHEYDHVRLRAYEHRRHASRPGGSCISASTASRVIRP